MSNCTLHLGIFLHAVKVRHGTDGFTSLLINLLSFWKTDLLVLFYKNTTMKSKLYLLSSVCVLKYSLLKIILIFLFV
jgi:hypothetical protein